jgi:hypothetical protein
MEKIVDLKEDTPLSENVANFAKRILSKNIFIY